MNSRIINRIVAVIMALGSLGILGMMAGIHADLAFLEEAAQVDNAQIPYQVGFAIAGTACLLLCLYASWLLFSGWNGRRFTIALMVTIAIVIVSAVGSSIWFIALTDLFGPPGAIGLWITVLGGAGVLRLCYVVLNPSKDSRATATR